MNTMTLDQLKPNERAEITAVQCDGTFAQRIMALGFLPGADVRVIQVAPFGDPIAVELDGWRLGLRRSEASLVSVKPSAVPCLD